MASIDDVVTAAQNLNKNLSQLIQTLTNTFPQQGGTSTSATTGAASTLPALPAGYLTVTIAGVARKVPYYT